MLTIISNFIINMISGGGYSGIAILMAIESAAIPLPSEVIMPFSGYLVYQGRFTLFGIALAGAVGSLVGSAVLYAVGYYGGRPLVLKYGKYVLISHKDLERAERFFEKHGDSANLIARILPVVRTFISFPAGVANAGFKKFLAYSFLGSFVWSLFLGWIGLKLGQNWQRVRGYFHGLDYIIGAVIIIGIVWYIARHIRHSRSID